MIMNQLENWRAIEALRAGVPNRDAVRILGTTQSHIIGRFTNLLDLFDPTSVEPGLIFNGGFGQGKSHLLEYLQHIALERNFVCSKIVISKETPLYNPGKVFTSAVNSATTDKMIGTGLNEIVTKLKPDTDVYASFNKWLNDPKSKMNGRFAATLHLFPRALVQDSEMAQAIVQFWSGDPLRIPELRSWLRQTGDSSSFRLDPIKPLDLAVQRYKFLSRLIPVLGYSGWIILVDEVELIGRYSLLQRIKSYAEISRLLGLSKRSLPGVLFVMAITDDFAEVVIEQKLDEEKIQRRFGDIDDEETALLHDDSMSAIDLIRKQENSLLDLDDSSLRDIFDKLLSVYASAYDWRPPSNFSKPSNGKSVRQHIKLLINDWDLRRLYPGYTPKDMVSEKLATNYNESPELSQDSERETAP